MRTRAQRPTSETGAFKASSNGHGASPVKAVSPPRSKVRLPELAVGLFVTVAFALGAVLWHLSSVDKVEALAIAAPVARGETIRSADLRVVYVASDDALARLDRSQADQIIGRVALVDLLPGTLLAPGLVADATALSPGDGVVGLALDPGQYPTLGIAPGDHVEVIRTDAESTDEGVAAIADNAVVFAVEDLTSDRKLISLLTTQNDGAKIAANAESSLRLVMVSP